MSSDALKSLLPEEYAREIRSTELGWQKYTMTNVSVELDENDRIDEVSALPTPWARMQFVEMAFSKWKGDAALEKTLTAEEKRIINYTFDLLELLFYQNFYSKELEFSEVPQFSADNIFARATRTFFDYELPTLIKVKEAGAPSSLLGSTSPYTLVYPAYHYISQSFPMGETRSLFDRNAKDIFLKGSRPEKFLAYLKFLAQQLPGDKKHPTQHFKTALLNATSDLQALGEDDLEALELDPQARAYSSDDEDSRHDNLRAKFTAGQPAFELRKLKARHSLQSPYFYSGNRVVIGGFNKGGENYVSGFPLKLKTAYNDVFSHSRSVLPNTIIKQQWVHEGDFFTPRLLQMPYELNADAFYLGVIEQTHNQHFAVPLANLYFENDQHWDENQHPKFETNLSVKDEFGKYRAEVEVQLQAREKPIRLSRLYEPRDVIKDLVDAAWAVKVFPNFYISNLSEGGYKDSIGDLPYFVSLFDETGNPNFPVRSGLRFFGKGNQEVKPEEADQQLRKKKLYSNALDALRNYRLGGPFRRIEVSFELGAQKEPFVFSLVPKFVGKVYNYNKDTGVRIGMDFGTTNTVVAYKFTGANNPIEIADFKTLGELTSFPAGTRIKELNEGYHDVFSRYFFEPQGYRNPIFRSVISYSKGTSSFRDWVNFNPYLHPEIPYPEETPNEVRTEFKWDINNEAFRAQAFEWVSHFITSNLLLLKYLLLEKEENMNLNNIKLIWFYPLAFDKVQLQNIRKIWNDQSLQVFPTLRNNIFDLDESIAPFINSLYYSSSNTNKILNIDIGGGTTDICLMKGTTPQLKLSLPIAGRNILGDLYNQVNNPLYHNRKVWALEEPEVDPADKKRKKQNSHEFFIKQDQRKKNDIIRACAPVICFFGFSILKYVKLVLDLNRDAAGEKKEDIYPDIIQFSGNGSKMFEQIMSNETQYHFSLKAKRHTFNKFVRLIFGKDISIEFSESLKEDTVKGGVRFLDDPQHAHELSADNTSVQKEIIGENINELPYDSLVGNIRGESTISINTEKGSYLLSEFLVEFHNMVKSDPQMFQLLFHSTSEVEIYKMEKYLRRQIEDKDYIKLQNFIAGGMKESGVQMRQLQASLLMYELQGIINEMTREA
ncbi:hypothetical protein V9K67_19095 [Paraflavisolibacter sp. H34]|uniref:hypothetical protein n=1 Tax=Huijunlia imazamoxiresistens TaxID=3127457 RepID=UPI003017D014